MLNRRHVRIKVLQSLYSHYSSGNEFTERETERNLTNSLYQFYNLYLYLMLFIKELALFAERYDAEKKVRHIQPTMETNINSKFYDNILVKKIIEDTFLENALSDNKIIWDTEDIDIIRKVFNDLRNQEAYKDFMSSTKNEEQENFEILSFVIKHYPLNFSLLEQHLEDKFLHWNDDAKPTVQMVSKSFKIIYAEPEIEDILVPISSDKKMTFGFAQDLLKISIQNNDNFNELISEKIDKWEPSRIALIDALILKMGLAEFLFFPQIPIKVTINECIELAKNYSTPNSKKFVNGVLDNLLKQLEKDNKINKKGIGTINNN
ncbi:MAG: transcription antitermination factor NusB [Bacteroidota bacterium]|nr:transcription antitermination factor NusB [Bacteroidota bacterium]